MAEILFGSVLGVLTVSLASTLGASLAFLLARYVARAAVAQRFGQNQKFHRLDRMTEEHGAIIVAITRLIPLFPFTLLNYGFGLTAVPFWTYVFWSWLCMLPMTVVFVVGADAVTLSLSEGRIPWYNLVVIGGGTAGLVTAIGGVTLGARVALVERLLMGGDCLNFGCVPSKALIRSSRAAYEIKRASDFGVRALQGESDFPRVMERMRRLRARISHHDSVERLTSLGIDVFLGDGRFKGPDCLEVDGKDLRFKKAVIATGGRPAQPSIEGLAEAGFLTSETVFSLTELPAKMTVIGGGPVGCELAQAFRRFGSQVTIIQRNKQFLPKEDREAAEILGGPGQPLFVPPRGYQSAPGLHTVGERGDESSPCCLRLLRLERAAGGNLPQAVYTEGEFPHRPAQ